MERVALIGAGLIGRAWAIVFARAGSEVALWDPAEGAAQAARDFAAEMVPELERLGLVEDAAGVLGRIGLADSMEAALEGAVHVQESTPERLEVKREVFATLDRLAGEGAVLASSTSAILPSAFSEGLEGRARCMVVHPINPAYLVRAAEVVPAPWTDPALIAATAERLRAAGMAPIVMEKEIDGFVMNRLQGALLEEAFRLVASGHAGVEDVDIGIREGLAMRWSFMGPFETIDLNAPGGVRDYVARYQGIYERIHPSMRERVDWAGPVLETVSGGRRALLSEEALAARQKWRDRRLMALAAHKRAAEREIG